MNGNILPRLSQRCKNHSADGRLEKDCESVHNFSGNTNRATGSFLESSENERNPYARKYFRKRQRFSGKTNQSPHQLTDEDEGDEDCSDIEQLIIKEEYVETTVCDTSPESPGTPTSHSFVASPSQVIEHKVCPYCPAMFESGVGLSNHVRGHLHRVGLSYNARHMVSPEQVALRDHQPRTRRRIPAGRRKIRRAVKTETQGEHTCPLCWGWFDTRTGLSNHVRGHLKRIGGSVTGSSKSPLCILNELLQDKEEHRNILQVLVKDQFLSGPSAAQKFISRSGLVLMRTALPAEITQHERKSRHATGDRFLPKQEAQVSSERDKLQENAQRGITHSSSTLVELLKMRQESMELAARNNQDAYPVRKLCVMTKDYKETQMTGYDYKQKKPRPRPGLKKKILPSLNAQIYTLTCRFCDLVFRGPLSIQEDWVKHLQRHLLHTSVPHSGTGMVEVLEKKPFSSAQAVQDC
uniref:C2H2-type domain-containing protein n=1 Tax=Echeneis naucrates TaxID=173247 RepID=A0A665W970_ECHNA